MLRFSMIMIVGQW